MDILKYFEKSFRREVKNIIERGDNQHVKLLVERLLSGKLNIRELFEYGVYNLPSRKNHQIDNDLSTYFMLISEIEGVSDKLYEFGYDLMIYCENSPRYDFLWAVEFRDENWNPGSQLEDILKESKL